MSASLGFVGVLYHCRLIVYRKKCHIVSYFGGSLCVIYLFNFIFEQTYLWLVLAAAQCLYLWLSKILY